MKTLLVLSIFSMVLLVQPASARTVEVDVHGMTCVFCVYSLKRKFRKMDSVLNVKVSLKTKKVRLETNEDLPSLETIKQLIREAGFTPTKAIVLPDKKSEK